MYTCMKKIYEKNQLNKKKKLYKNFNGRNVSFGKL